MISRTLLLLAVVGMACAATWQGFVPQKPQELAHKEGCYVKEINDVVPFGSTVTPIGYCYRISCGTTIMSYASCGKIAVKGDDFFLTPMDLTKPYPDCCPGIERVSNNKV